MMAFSTLSSEEKRFSVIEPVRRLRIFACTKPRRLPGVRWDTLKTEYNSLLNLITMPGRICVEEIMNLPDCVLDLAETPSIAGWPHRAFRRAEVKRAKSLRAPGRNQSDASACKKYCPSGKPAPSGVRSAHPHLEVSAI